VQGESEGKVALGGRRGVPPARDGEDKKFAVLKLVVVII